MVCNLEAAVLIHSFKVEEDEMVPTRSIVKITVTRNAMRHNRSSIRSLPSLDKPSEQRSKMLWKRRVKDNRNTVAGEERQRHATENRKELTATAGKHFKGKEHEFDEGIKE